MTFRSHHVSAPQLPTSSLYCPTRIAAPSLSESMPASKTSDRGGNDDGGDDDDSDDDDGGINDDDDEEDGDDNDFPDAAAPAALTIAAQWSILSMGPRASMKSC